MSRFLIFVLFTLGVVGTSVGIAEVYKWVDDEGTVHYSDTPREGKHETVVVEPGYPEAAASEAPLTAPKKKAETGEETVTKPHQPGRSEEHAVTVDSVSGDIDCFSPLAAAWGGGIADTREAVSRRALSDEEYRRLETLLDGMVGRWWGSVEDLTCRSPKSAPPSRTDYYRVRLDARHRIGHIFKIEGSLVGTGGTRAELRQYFWLLLSHEGMRFREGRNDIVVELDQPRDDVGLLHLDSSLLTFFWRHDDTIRRVTVLSLQQTDTGFIISEYFYAQGQLSGKRQWLLGR